MEETNGKSNSSKYVVAAGIVVIIIAAAVVFFSLTGKMPGLSTVTNTTPGAGGSGSLAMQITDPATVPAGTQSLIIVYSGVDLHETGTANNTGFVNFSSSGTINLLNLTNVSQTIAIIQTQAGQSFNLIRFDIKSANITINNVTYNVTLATKGVIAKINSSVNATSSGGVLLDLSPTVIQVYTSSNQSIFVLVPSATAIAIGRGAMSGNVGTYVGARVGLHGYLASALYAQRPNITITSATASEAGNVTQLQVTVKNNGNSSVRLSDIAVKGFFEAIPSFSTWNPPIGIGINAGAGVSSRSERAGKVYGNASASITSIAAGKTWDNGTYLNASTSASASGTVWIGPSAQINSSLNSTLAADLHLPSPVAVYSDSGAVYNTAGLGLGLGIGEAEIFSRNFHNQLNFIVESNGTLELPYSLAAASCPAIMVSTGNTSASANGCGHGSFGYQLAPGASATLTFDGVIHMPNVGVVVSPQVGVRSGASDFANWVGPRINNAVVVLIPNQTYRVVAHGYRGAYALANVTATGYVTNFSPQLVDVTNVQLGLLDVSTGAVYNETMAGFISHSNSTVAYSVYSYGGPYVIAVPRLSSYDLNVTGFTVNTAGFALVNYTAISYPSPCPVCTQGVCPDIACIYGSGRVYLLNIKMPPTNYTGALSITEDYTPPAVSVNTTSGSGT